MFFFVSFLLTNKNFFWKVKQSSGNVHQVGLIAATAATRLPWTISLELLNIFRQELLFGALGLGLCNTPTYCQYLELDKYNWHV